MSYIQELCTSLCLVIEEKSYRDIEIYTVPSQPSLLQTSFEVFVQTMMKVFAFP